MTKITSSYVPVFAVGDVRNCGVSFDRVLADSETISGVTVTEDTTSDLTIANEAATASAAVIADELVPTGRGVVFTVSGQLDAVTYTLKITVTTSGSETIIRYVTFTGEDV